MSSAGGTPTEKIRARFKAQHPLTSASTPVVRTNSDSSGSSRSSWMSTWGGSGWGDSSKHSPWASFKRLGSGQVDKETFTQSFYRLSYALTPSEAFFRDCKLSLADVMYTITFLCGIAGTSAWADVCLPRVCAAADPTYRVLGFNCIEGVIFTWIFATSVLWTVALPYHAFNPWAAALASEFTARQRFMKFAAQVGAAVSFAFLCHRVLGLTLASRIYAESFPKMHLCEHPSASSFHVDLFKAKPCIAEWPNVDDGGNVHLGATLWEAIHTLALNTVLGLILPFFPPLIAPVVVAIGVVSTIRSPWGHHTGPALNLAVASASAAFHGGWDALRVHALGTFIGVICAGYVVNGIGLVVGALVPHAEDDSRHREKTE